MTYKAQQVLRTVAPVKAEDGTQVAAGTRVVVLGQTDTGQIRVKVVDPKQPTLKARVVTDAQAFTYTQRGRPKRV